jgi:hypothetical protein
MPNDHGIARNNASGLRLVNPNIEKHSLANLTQCPHSTVKQSDFYGISEVAAFCALI